MIDNENIKNKLFSRLKKYCEIDTQSDNNSKTYPSTEKQWILAKMLKKELEDIGMKKVNLDRYCYLTAQLPSNVKEKRPVIAFLAHIDTAPAFNSSGVKVKLRKNYDGKDIIISEKNKIKLNINNCPPLKEHIGDDIITASGDTLLGADDKAGIAIIMTAMEYLIKSEIPHGEIKIAFTPDEEVGRGVNYFNVKKFGADYAYTFDGDLKGAIEMETFNADGIKIKVYGKSVHPGSAKNAMANSVRILSDIINSWPENYLPETTENYDGFIMFDEIRGDVSYAEVTAIAREHNLNKLKYMEKLLEKIIEEKRFKYPLAKIEFEIEEQYRNMREVIEKHPLVMEKLISSLKKAGLDPKIKPVRGGTDGARLSFMGLPAPNVFTGGYNYHGPYEWISLDSMLKSFEVLLNLAELWSVK
jgi:tripeptide aminopeptidase